MRRGMAYAAIILIFGLIAIGCSDQAGTTTQRNTGTSNPMGTVQGFVRDFRTNAPIQNAVITLYATGSQTTTTDIAGYWYFDRVQASMGSGLSIGISNTTISLGSEGKSIAYTITPPDNDADGQADYLPMSGMTSLDETVGTLSDVGQTNSLVTVTDYMVGTANISGFVTDAASGKGILNATVVLSVPSSTALTPSMSNAHIELASQYTATTGIRNSAAASTKVSLQSMDGVGWYSMLVPALSLSSDVLGAYAEGFEYNTFADGSSLNLQYANNAIVDFMLNPIDNKLGLVEAAVSVAPGLSEDMLILNDASGSPANGPMPDIDINNATQLSFTLIFDQSIDMVRFYGSTIELVDMDGNLVAPNLMPTWVNEYTLILTGSLDYIENNVGMASGYILRTGSSASTGYIYASNGIGQSNMNLIGPSTDLASFHLWNSAFAPANPEPALYIKQASALDDSSITGHNGVFTYRLTSVTNPTTASNYTGIFENVPKNVYAMTQNAMDTGLDIFWPETQPVFDLDSYNVYVRERDTESGEVLTNWHNVSYTTQTVLDNIIALDLQLPVLYGGTLLRYGNVLDIAVTITDPRGVENSISESDMLTISDSKSPELTGFISTSYQNGGVIFSEPMDSTASTNVETLNTALMSMSPAFEMDDPTRLRLNVTGTATATVCDTCADDIDNTGLITFSSSGDADLFYTGQTLTLTYNDGSTQEVTVTSVKTGGANPTITITAPTGNITKDLTIAVSGNNVIRSGDIDTMVMTTTNFTLNTPGACQNVAVGDILLVRASNGSEGDTTVLVNVVDTTGATVVVAINKDLTGSPAYDTVVCKGDILTITAKDEAGNAMHADADEITPNIYGAWPSDPAIK